jgi:hypothetical protein
VKVRSLLTHDERKRAEVLKASLNPQGLINLELFRQEGKNFFVFFLFHSHSPFFSLSLFSHSLVLSLSPKERKPRPKEKQLDGDSKIFLRTS